MAGHRPHKLTRQAVEVTADHLVLAPPAGAPYLGLTYLLQLGRLGPGTPANVGLLVGNYPRVLERLAYPIPLRWVRDGCRTAGPWAGPLDEADIVPLRPAVEIGERLRRKVPPVQEVKGHGSEDTDRRVSVP